MNWFKKFMYGRYGLDQLSIDLAVLSIVIIVLSGLLPRSLSILSIIGYIPMIIYIYRIFSKNIFKRQTENYKYLSKRNKVIAKLKNDKDVIRDFKTYKYFKCSNCGQRLRVPRRQGKISITCPKCKNTFKAKS